MPDFITLFGNQNDQPEPEPEEAGKSGFFSRMKQAVTRTRETFSTRINDIVALTREVDEAALEDLETALLTSDIGVQTTTEILEALRERARKRAIEGGAELRGLLKEQIQGILEAPRHPVAEPGISAEGDVSGGRERDGQDDLGGQAGGLVPRSGSDCAAVRGRYVSRCSD